MSLNRLLVVLLILVLLGAGGFGGFWWWKDQPKQLYASAEQYYKQGEQLAGTDPAAAKQAFLNADAKLERLLDLKKDPKNSHAWFKRFEVQRQLYRIYKKEEGPDAGQRAEKARINGQTYIEQAAKDRTNINAQLALLNQCFIEDRLNEGLTYAENLLDSNVEQNEEFLKNHHTEMAAAHFLKGQAALAAVPPREEEALGHVRACVEIQRKVPDARDKMRWREIDLEARALRMKGRSAVSKDDFKMRIQEWVNRAHEEKKEVAVPAEGEKPAQSFIVLLHPSNMRGLFSFLNVAIEMASTPEEIVDRANLLLDYCDALIGAKLLTPKSLDFVNRQLAQLPKTLRSKTVAEKYEKLPEETRDKLRARIEKLTDKNKQAGAVMDPALYAQLAQDACDECRVVAAESLALGRICFGLAILQAEERAAKTNDPDRKAALARLADEAREEQRKLSGGRTNPRQSLKT